MHKKLIMAAFIITAMFASGIEEPRSEINFIPDPSPPARKVYVGAWVGGSWESKTKTLNVSVTKDFQNIIDKQLAIVNIFSEWTYLSDPNLLEDLNELSSHNWIPLLSSNPLFFDDCRNTGNSLYETIASGSCDTFIKSIATNLKSYGKPIMLRFAWEMNLPQMYWSVEKVGSSPDDFIAAWRHFHTLVSNEKADNVIWVLSFNTSHSGTTPYKDLYPGDDYVDWVALDGYNWGSGFDWGGWASFDGTFRNSYTELTQITGKPVMLSEVNSSPKGGDKAAWLRDMLNVQIIENYPQVGALIFFNENKTDGESVDWRIELDDRYIEAVRSGLKNELYVSSFP